MMTRTQKLLRDQRIRAERQRKQNRQMLSGIVMLATIFVTPLAVAALLS
jgi:hypothetical protein